MLGIDLSKESLVASYLDPNDRSLRWRDNVQNGPVGFARLHERTPVDSAWVIEPTSRYSRELVLFARSVGRKILLANPNRSKAFLRSVKFRVKNDRLDSEGLALYALSQPLRPYPLKPEQVEKLDQLLSARRSLTRALTAFEQQSKDLPYARESLQAAIEDVKSRVGQVDWQIASASEAPEISEHVKRLKKVNGIGPVTAAAVASRLLAKGFTHSDQFVAYIGLDVRVNQSGARNTQGRLTKHGDAELRRLLFNCARSTARSPASPFHEQLVREKAKGLSSTAAHCAIARKLARVCWSVFTHKAEYDPERVFTRPPRQEPEQPANQEDMRSPAPYT